MRRSHAISQIAIVTVALCAALPAAATSQPGDPARFESDPIRGGNKWVVANFKLTPKWDRVRLLILDGTEMKASELAEWVKWANGLQSIPVIERLLAINKRVNKEFKYASDRKIWGKPDYWAQPVASRPGRCGWIAGTTPSSSCSWRISRASRTKTWRSPSARSPAPASTMPSCSASTRGLIYVLDNRSRYVRDTAGYSDFQVMYSVGFDDVWLYPASFRSRATEAPIGDAQPPRSGL